MKKVEVFLDNSNKRFYLWQMQDGWNRIAKYGSNVKQKHNDP